MFCLLSVSLTTAELTATAAASWCAVRGRTFANESSLLNGSLKWTVHSREPFLNSGGKSTPVFWTALWKERIPEIRLTSNSHKSHLYALCALDQSIFVVRWLRALEISELQAHNKSKRAALWACMSAILDTHTALRRSTHHVSQLTVPAPRNNQRGFSVIIRTNWGSSEVIYTKLDPVDDNKKGTRTLWNHGYYTSTHMTLWSHGCDAIVVKATEASQPSLRHHNITLTK